MKPFMDEDFLLDSKTSQILYHEYAQNMPIIDYHCHINPAEIADNRRFDNITQLWLGGDHYKWRIIRANGVEESKITGNEASDWEKFLLWSKALPKAIGNPLYHWTHLELKRYFGISDPLNEKTAASIWEQCNQKLQTLRVRDIIRQSNVKVICTTDDPCDELIEHKKIQNDSSCDFSVVPAFRPDKAINLEKPEWNAYLDLLGERTNRSINTFLDLCEALKDRLSYFVSLGCKVSDHGIDRVCFVVQTPEKVEQIFAKRRCGKEISAEEKEVFQTALMLFLGSEYHRQNVVMQLHYGAARNCNQLCFDKLGPDTGFDAISPHNGSLGLAPFLNALTYQHTLPKTIIYSLNPHDNEIIDSIIGCFQDGSIPGKIQHGAAWWFNDHQAGMEKHLTDLANASVLGNFVGMLTDSRSFLSYTRHEYFRRILCNVIGTWVEEGKYPNDLTSLGQMVQNISYYNAASYFGF
jgi:glucuronate isomerase